MKAVKYHRHGEPSDVLMLEDVPDLPPPGPQEVVVRVVKRLVHPIDHLAIRGIVPRPIPPKGATPGGDGVGVVERVGSGVDPSTGIVPGARVALHPAYGTWAERLLTPATGVIPLPRDVSDTVACQIAANGVTAIALLRAVEAADPRAGIDSPLLVTAAGSSVGRNVIALASMRGVKVVAAVRSDESAAILTKSFPGLPIVCTEREGWPAAVVAAGGTAPTVAIDPIGGSMTPQFLELLANRGTLLTYGGLDASPSMISTIVMTLRELTIKGVAGPGRAEGRSFNQRAADFAELFEMTRRAPQNYREYQEFTLSECVQALSAARATPRRGATILTTGS
jgi:NADPH:quinone reductase-like Zn-dependent oxidoreductase